MIWTLDDKILAMLYLKKQYGNEIFKMLPKPLKDDSMIRADSMIAEDIARQIGSISSNLVKPIKKLIEKGLIEIVENTKNRRSKQLRITEKGIGYIGNLGNVFLKDLTPF